MSGIGVSVYYDASGMTKLFQTLNAVPGAAEKATRKSISEFEKMAKSIRSATEQLDYLVEKSKKPLNSLGNLEAYKTLTNELKTSGKSAKDLRKDVRDLSEMLTAQERALQSLIKKTHAYNQGTQETIAQYNIIHARQTASIKQYEKIAVAIEHAKAKFDSMATGEAKYLANLKALTAAREKLNAALAAKQTVVVADTAQAQIFEAQAKAAVRAQNAYKLLNVQLKDLQTTEATYRNGVAGRVAVQKEVNKGLEQQATYEQKLANSLQLLVKASADKNSKLLATIAVQKEVNKGTEQEAVAYVKLSNTLKGLSQQLEPLMAAKAREIAVTKEKIKGLEQEASYEQRLINSKKALESATNSSNLWLTQAIAKQKEYNKGIEQLASYEQKLINQLNLYTEAAKSKNATISASIAVQKELNKGYIDQATYTTRLANKIKELQAQNASLQSGQARLVAELKVQNQYLEKAATYYTKLVGEQSLLIAMSDSTATAIRHSNIERQTEINLGDKLAKINAEYAYATGAVTAALWKQAQTRSTNLAGMRDEATFADRMKNKYEELSRSIAYLSSAEGQRHSNLTTQEKLQKRLNDLLARSTTENKKLLAQIAALEAEERKLLGTTRSLSTSFGALQQVAAATRATMSGLGAAFGSYTSATLLVSLATFAVVRNMREMVKVGAEFEDNITRVAAISNKAAFASVEYQNALASLKARAIEVAATSRFMSTEVTQAMNELAMAGLNSEEIIMSVRDTMNLAAIGAIGFGESADIATNILMGFQLNVEQLGDVVDKMALAVTSSNQNISQLGNAMSYAAPVASAFGVSLEFIVAATEVLANSGIKASRAGTSLRRIMVSLFTPTKKGAEAMRSMGIEVANLGEGMEGLEMLDSPIGADMFKGMATGTQQLVDKLKQLYIMTAGATTNIDLLYKIVDVRALPAMIQLIKSMDDGTRSLFELEKALQGAGGTAEETIRKITNTLKGQWQIFVGSIEAIQQGVFENEAESLTEFVKGLTSASQSLAQNREALAELVEFAKAAGSAFLELIKAVLVVKAALMFGSAIAWLVRLNTAVWSSVAAFTGLQASSMTASAVLAATGAKISATWASIAASFSASMAATAGFGRAAQVAAAGVWVLNGAFTALSALLKVMLVPALIAGAVYGLVTYFTDLDKSVKAASDRLRAFKDEVAAGDEFARAEADDLLNGGLSDLYAKIEAQEDLVKTINEEVKKNKASNDQLLTARKHLNDLKSDAASAHEAIRKYGQTSLITQISDFRQKLEDTKKSYDELLARKAKLEEIKSGNIASGGWLQSVANETRIIPQLEEVNTQLREQELLMEGYGNAISQLTAKQVIAVGTVREHFTLFSGGVKTAQIQLEEYTAKLKGLKAAYDVLSTAQSFGGIKQKDGTLRPLEEAEGYNEVLLALETTISELSTRIGPLKDKLETLQLALKAADRNTPATFEDLLTVSTRMREEFDRLQSSVGRTEDQMSSMDFSRTITSANYLRDAVIASFDAIAASEQEMRNVIASKGESAVTEMTEEHTRLLSAHGALLDKYREQVTEFGKLTELEAKYDPAIRGYVDLSVAVNDLVGIYGGGRRTLDDFSERLGRQIGETLELDKATGQLTETSKKSITELGRYVAEEISMTERLLASLRQSPVSEDTSKAIAANELRLTALREAYNALGGDLASLVLLYGDTKKDTKDITDLYSDQVEILKLLGANTASLALSRKAETKELTGLAKKLKEFKFLLDDINQIQEDALEEQSFGTDLINFYKDLDEETRSLLGERFVNVYDPTEVLNSTQSLKDKALDAMQGVGDLGQAIDLQMNTAFDTLEERLARLTEQFNASIRSLTAEMAALGNSPASAASPATGVSAAITNSLTGLIKQFEGLELDAYLDQAGIPTIGYGHTGPEVKLGLRIDTNQAEALLTQDVQRFADAVKSSVTVALTEGQFNALTSLAYNIGEGAFKGSTLLKKLNSGDYEGAAGEFGKWNKVTQNGVKVESRGLTNRRLVEEQVFRDASSTLTQTAAAANPLSTALDKAAKSSTSLKEATKATTSELKNSRTTIEADLSTEQIWEKESAALEQLHTNYVTLIRHREDLINAKAPEEAIAAVTDQLNNTREQAVAISAKLSASQTEAIKNGQLLTYTYQLEEAQLNQLRGQYNTTSSALQNFYQDRANILQLLNSGDISADRAFELIEEKALDVIATQGKWSAYWADLKKDMQDFSEFSIDVFDEFKDTLVDALVEGKADFSDFTSYIKRKLAELAVNTIVVNVIGNVTGLTGTLNSLTGVGATGSSVAGAASSLGSLSNLSSLLSLSSWKTGLSNTWSSIENGLSWLSGNTSTSALYGTNFGSQQTSMLAAQDAGFGSYATGGINWANLGAGALSSIGGYFLSDALFDGDYVSIGSTIGGAAGTAMGSTLATAFSVAGPVGTAIGALLGSVAGGGLASLFGGGEPEFGGYQMSFSGKGFEDDVKAQGSFGLSFGATGTGTTNMDVSEMQDVFDGFAGMTNILADFYGSDLEGKVKNAIWSQIGDYEKLGTSTSEAVKTVFNMISTEAVKAEEDLDGPAHALAAAVEQAGGLTALGDSAADMTKVIEGGIEAATYAAKLFGTEAGRLMGLGLDEEFDSVVESAKALTWYVQAFWEEGETTSSMIERFVENLSALNLAVTMTNTSVGEVSTSLEDLGYSALELMIIADDLRKTIEATGLTMAEFTTLQSNYYNQAYTDAERAQHQINSANKSIAAWNQEMGFTGDSMITTLAQLRKYIEGLDESSHQYNELYVAAIEASGAFVLLDQAMQTLANTADEITDFIESIKPDSVKLDEMIDIFGKYGLEMPSSSDQLYEWIMAGKVADELLEYLAKNTDKFNSALSALSSIQSDLLDKLDAKYDEVVKAAEDRSDLIIEKLEEAYDAELDALEKAYDARVDQINDEIDALEKLIDVVEGVADALESLKQQTEGPNVTRVRYLDMAKAALEQYNLTGEFPSNIQDIISKLGNVDPNDFKTREDWLAAIDENEAVLKEFEKLAGGTAEELDTQIKLLEKQLDQEKELYEQAKEDAESRLDTAIKAEEDRLKRELAALETIYNKEKALIESMTASQLLALSEQTDWLEKIFSAITDGWGGADDPLGYQVDLDKSRDIINNMPGGSPDSERGLLWQSMQDIVSDYGRIELDMPELGFTDAYDKMNKLLNLWDSQGLISAADKQELRNLLEPYGVGFDLLGTITSSNPLPVTVVSGFDLTESMRKFNAMPGGSPDSERGLLWQAMQDIISNNGAIELDMPELGFTDAYDKVDKLLKLWDSQDLIEPVLDSLKAILDPYGIGFESLGTVKGFAKGGFHSGGLRLVGERGPELEYTGPSTITPNQTLPEIFSRANQEMAEELRSMRQELAESKRIQAEQAKLVEDLVRVHKRWDGGGMPPDREGYLEALAEA